MIERVARALAVAAGYDPDEVSHNPLNNPEGPHWTRFAGDARTAIEAMREPNEAMLTVVVAQPDGRLTYDYSEAGILRRAREDIYRSMIAAALQERAP